MSCLYTWRHEQNVHHCANIFKCIFMNENGRISHNVIVILSLSLSSSSSRDHRHCLVIGIVIVSHWYLLFNISYADIPMQPKGTNMINNINEYIIYKQIHLYFIVTYFIKRKRSHTIKLWGGWVMVVLRISHYYQSNLSNWKRFRYK